MIAILVKMIQILTKSRSQANLIPHAFCYELENFICAEKKQRRRDAEEKKSAASLLAALRRKSLSLRALRLCRAQRLCADEIQYLKLEKVVNNNRSTRTRARARYLRHRTYKHAK